MFVMNVGRRIPLTRGFEQKPEWSVWVGRVRVNQNPLRLQEAQDLANDFERQDYSYVAVVQDGGE